MGDDGSAGSVDDGGGDLPAWLDERVAEADMPRETFLDAVAVAYEAAASNGAAPPTEAGERITELEAELEALREDFEENLTDVRQRVLQVRDMAEPVDGHAGDGEGATAVEERITAVADTQTSIESELDAVEDRLDALEDRVTDGFENYESILNDVVESTRRHNARLDTLARVTRTNRDTLDRVAGEQSERTRMDDLATAANRAGVRSARCDSCGVSLDIALLTRPECPECGAAFADVTPATGFFGSATLRTGSPPALAAGETTGRSDPIEDMETDPTND